MFRHRVARSLGLAVLLVTGSTVGGVAEAAAATYRPAPLLYDDALASVTVPGFAGVWVDPAAGGLVVSLTRPTDAAARAARVELAGLLGRPDLATMPVVARPARFSFRQLKAWYDDVVGDVLTTPGAVSADIDERANVLRFGMQDVAAASVGISTILGVRGVPAAAVVTERATPVVQELGDEIRPLVGGVQITLSEIAAGRGANTCTLGFPAVKTGIAGFVTNAHCTYVQGALDGVELNQPVAGKPVGREIADPPFLPHPDCPSARPPQQASVTLLCRYSDSAFIQLLDGVSHDLGTLARPPDGSTTWNGTDTFRITSEGASILGDSLTKVGRTTGRTSGDVTETCLTFVLNRRVTINSTSLLVDTPLALLCQNRAGYLSAGGDSGSPVFATTTGTDDVQLRGIHWGANGLHSPIANITMITELGDLSTCTAASGC